MAHSNSTQYYNLPQFDSTDKPAWLVDVNPAYAAIDAGIHAAKAAADAAQGDATQALSDASSAGTTASGADAKASGAIASLAEAFDTTATYDVGDLVIYNNLLYICTVAITVPGAWTGTTNWSRYTVDDISTLLNTVAARTGSDIDVSDSDTTKIGTAIASLTQRTDISTAAISISGNVPTDFVDRTLVRFGNVIFVTLSVRFTNNVAADTVFATIPEGFRPTITKTYPCGMIAGSNDAIIPSNLKINTNGEISQGQSNSCKGILLTAIYNI